METKPNTTGVDIVTINQAPKRLGNQAPARQSFYSAVNKGKIREVTDKDNPKATRMVSWTSVLEYIAGGGFKPRVKSTSITESQTEDASPPPGQIVPEIPIDRVTAEAGMPNPPPHESPLPHSSINGENRPPGQTPAKPHRSQKPNHSGSMDKPAAQSARTTPKAQVKPAGNEKPKVRSSPPLRVIKNGLRHLDFEQTKAIRDWADNRLLTVLRPASPLASTDANNEYLQHA